MKSSSTHSSLSSSIGIKAIEEGGSRGLEALGEDNKQRDCTLFS